MTKPNYLNGAAFVDGEYVPVAEAKLSLLDLGFTRSDATYDVAHVWHGSFFRIEDHLTRFLRSCEKWRFQLPFSRQEVKSILMHCVALSGLRDAYVEMTVTRGDLVPGTRDPRACKNQFFAYAIPFVWILPFDRRYDGLHLDVSSYHRISPKSVDPTVKNFHWADLTQGLFEAYDKGCDTTVLIDESCHVTEGPGFNILCIKNGAIASPSGTVFEGITRQTVEDICTELGVPFELRPVSVAELHAADEVFLSSTAGGVMPVRRLRDKQLPGGDEGTLTRRIVDRYWALHTDSRFSTPVDHGD